MDKGENEQQKSSYLDIDERSDEATNDLIQTMFPDEPGEGVEEGDAGVEENSQGEEEQETGDTESGQESSEEATKNTEGQDLEKNEEAESEKDKSEQGDQSLDQLSFIKDAVSELLPDDKQSFETEDDYKSAVNCDRNQVKSQQKPSIMPKQLEFIRLHDLANLFGVSKVTIWRMRKRGEIPPPIRISRYVVGWPRPTIEKILYDDESRSTVNLENWKETK